MKGGEKLNKGVSLNQYHFKAPAKESSKNNSYQAVKGEQSFAEKMKALQNKRNEKSRSASKNENRKDKSKNLRKEQKPEDKKDKLAEVELDKSDKDLKKVDKDKLKEMTENIFVQLSQLNLSSEDQQKLEAVLNEAGLSTSKLKAVEGQNISAADIELSKLNEGSLKELISNLETLLSESEIDLNQKTELTSLINLLKEIESSGTQLSENQSFNEGAAEVVTAENKSDLKPLKEKTAQVVDGKPLNADKSAAVNELLNFNLSESDKTDLNQQVDLEQNGNLKENVLAQVTNDSEGKNNQELKFFNSMTSQDSAELNLEGLAKLIQGQSSTDGKDSNLNFFGTESFLNAGLETNSGENVFDLNTNSELKQNLPVKDQFVQKFRGEFSAAKNEMNLELKPDSLGKIEVKLNLDQGKIDAKMIVESKFVQSQLENSMQEIKTDLLKQGINIEQFKIETAKNAPKQVEQQNAFDFNDQNSAFSDGETGQNQEYEQRQFFQGQYYVQRNVTDDSLNSDELIMRQQEIINRAAFSKGKLNLIV